jgi:predicted DNA binding CopG/RHH family protein
MTKRILLNVEDSLHSKLKQRAAAEGVSLNALCSRLLEESDEREPETQIEPAPDLFEPMLYISLPLNILREELQRVANAKIDNREKSSRLMKINSEMAKRYRR